MCGSWDMLTESRSDTKTGRHAYNNTPLPTGDGITRLPKEITEQAASPPMPSSADPTQHPKPQLWWFTHFHTAMPQTLHWLQWGAPHSPPKLPPPMVQSPNQTTCLIPGPIRPIIPNRIHIRSAVLPQCTGQTDTQTNRWLEGMFDGCKPLLLYRECRGLKYNLQSFSCVKCGVDNWLKQLNENNHCVYTVSLDCLHQNYI